MDKLQKNYVESYRPEPAYPKYEETTVPEKETEVEDSVVEEVEYEEQTTLKVTPSSSTDRVVVDTNTHANLSKLEGKSVRFVDFYKDARTFLEKANSTKFVIVAYILLSSPVLLMMGHLSEDVYREILIIISLTYLGVDAYERKNQVRKR